MRVGGRLGLLLLCLSPLGCGTTRWSDTPRTATEQLLLSDAVDRAVSRVDFRALAGRKIYLDCTYADKAIDSPYLISCLRQQMLASGCIVKTERDQADYIVEVRAGAVGTDRNDLLFGVPSMNLPQVMPGVPSQIPELALAKKTQQRGVAKIALFAYNRTTGRPVWQSGVVPAESNAKDLWVFGAGPFQHGNIYEGTQFAGSQLDVPLIYPGGESGKEGISVADEAYFVEPDTQVALAPKTPKSEGPAKDEPASQAAEKPAGPAPAALPVSLEQPRRMQSVQAPPNPGDDASPAPPESQSPGADSKAGRSAPLPPPVPPDGSGDEPRRN